MAAEINGGLGFGVRPLCRDAVLGDPKLSSGVGGLNLADPDSYKCAPWKNLSD